MTTNSALPRPRATSKQVDEAAVWMTLLHSSSRNEHTDAGFRRWLKAHPAHAEAFEKVAVAHELTAALPRGAFPRIARWERAGYRDGFRKAVLAAAVIAAITVGTLFYLHNDELATDIGEQRTVSLEDGSQVYLNTDTRVAVNYTRELRSVELHSGEAFFDVAKEIGRPFVVTVAEREIRAIGTSFVVRRDRERVAVTLIEGKVAVAAPGQPRPMMLAAGERAVFDTEGSLVNRDKPALEKVTAWRRGQLDFDEVPLAHAVTEMNRYSSTKLTVAPGADGSIPITGVFKTGAAKSFAVAVADEYHLRVREMPGEIWLEKAE